MGKIELDHTGSGSGVTLSSDGTDLLLDGTAIGGAGGGGDLLAANNLSDVASASTSRINLGLAIGSDVQAHSSVLDGTTASFTTAEESKLAGIEAGATADQTNAEIRAAVEAATDSNIFTDADHTKLNGIEASADVTDVTNVTAAGALMDSEVTNLAQVKAFNSADYATAAQGTTADAALSRTGGAMTGAITTNSTFDGRDVATDGAKLDGIAANATAYSNSDVDTHLNTSTASASEVLSWTGSDYDWVAQSGGGASLELYAENPSSPTAPSATGTNAVAIGNGSTSSGNNSIAIGQSANAANGLALGKSARSNGSDATAIGPYARADANSSTAIGASNSGQGAKTASGGGSVALGGSYASGVDAFAAAIATNSATYGAQGNNSVAIGDRAKSTGASAVAIGQRATASANYSMALGAGNGVVEASVAEAIAMGTGAYSNLTGKLAFSSGTFGTSLGHAQTGIFVLRRGTTDATPNVLATTASSGNTSNQVVLPNNSALSFHGTIVARQQASQGTASAAWKVEGLIRREGSAGTTVLVNSATTVLDNTPSWGMALSADTTNGGLKIEVTGAAATNIRWVGTIHTSEVTYA